MRCRTVSRSPLALPPARFWTRSTTSAQSAVRPVHSGKAQYVDPPCFRHDWTFSGALVARSRAGVDPAGVPAGLADHAHQRQREPIPRWPL